MDPKSGETMKTIQPARPMFLLWVFRLFAVVGFIPFLINTVDILLHIQAPTLDPTMDLVSRAFLGLFVSTLTLVIAVLCIRRVPNNIIGWMLAALAYGISVQVIRLDFIPVTTNVLIVNWFIIFFWLAFITIALYFPDGQLYPPAVNRWGNPAIALFILTISIISMISSPTMSASTGPNSIEVANPFFLLDWDYTKFTMPGTMLLMLAGIITFIFRYRNSRSVERIQLRWFLFGLALQCGLTLFTFLAPEELQRLTHFVTPLFGLIFPVTIGISILRYRLYDIDLIIRRTLQYGILSVFLGLVYFGLIVLFGQLFQGVTGQNSPVAIVISTLVIAALFNPLRTRIQRWIDRRFYRAKYDADQAVESFTVAARSQVELETLATRLAETAQESLQPEAVWVWIRKQENQHSPSIKEIT
jgi:hypothetical protein